MLALRLDMLHLAAVCGQQQNKRSSTTCRPLTEQPVLHGSQGLLMLPGPQQAGFQGDQDTAPSTKAA